MKIEAETRAASGYADRPSYAGMAIADALPGASLAKLIAYADCQIYTKGQVIFRRGDAATGLYVLSEGQVRLILPHPTRQERVLRLVKRGEIFGDVAVFMESRRVLTAQAGLPSTVLHIPTDVILKVIQEDRQVAMSFLSLLSRQIHGLVTEIEAMAVGSGMFRVVQFILDEVAVQKLRLRGVAQGMVMPATKQDVASLLNLSKEHFSRMLADLVQQGLITMSGRYVGIPNISRLKEWHTTQACRNKAH